MSTVQVRPFRRADRLALLGRRGFRELTRTARGWTRHPDRAQPAT